MLDITPNELFEILQQDPERIQLIDVREQEEHDQFNIGGACIPLPDIVSQISSYISNKPLVLYCSKGIRSAIAIQRLEQKYPDQQFYNLSGGLTEWSKTIGS